MQHECLTGQGLGDGVGVRDAGQLGVEHAREGEQLVALALQRNAHRADPSRVLVLAGGELGDEKVEQLPPGGQVRASESQDVLAQSVHKGADVTGEPVCLGFGLSRTIQLGGQLVLRASLAGAAKVPHDRQRVA